jgi:azurin
MSGRSIRRPADRGTAALAGLVVIAAVVACGGPAPTPVPLVTEAPTLGPRVTPASTGSPAGPSAAASTPRGTVQLTVDTATGAGDFHYAQTELEAPAGSEIKLRLNNLTDAADEVGHNWVLVVPGQEASVLANGIAAGDDRDWLDTNDPGIIAASRLIEGGERDDVTFDAPAPGVYTFLCTFPKHFDGGMKGTLTIK